MADKKSSHERAYTVVRVGGGRLEVLRTVIAKSQETACDQAVEGLPPPERNGVFAAYLASSYREFGYRTEATVVTTKERRAVGEPSIPERVGRGDGEVA